MKSIYIVLLLLLFNIVFVFCDITLYISNSRGRNVVGCGKTLLNSCKSIHYAIKKSKYLNQYNVNLLLESGEYLSEETIDAYGLNLTISSLNNGLVVLGKTMDNDKPHFQIECLYYSTSSYLNINGITIDNCYLNDVYQGSFLQFADNYSQNATVGVNLNNVKFKCSVSAPLIYYSSTIYNSFNSTDSDLFNNNNDESLTSYNDYNSSSSGGGDYSTSGSSGSYYSSSGISSSNSFEYNSGSYNPNNNIYYFDTFSDMQAFGFWPSINDNIKITFTFSNCLFLNDKNYYNYLGINRQYLFVSYNPTHASVLNVFNSTFENFKSYNGIVKMDSGLVTFNNINFNNTYHQYESLFTFTNSRISFNNVNFNNSTLNSVKSLVSSTSSLFTGYSFNLLINSAYVDNLFSFYKSAVFIENSNQIVSPYNANDDYSSNPYYSLDRSNLYLFSNNIISRVNSLLNLYKSSVFINRNLIKIESYNGLTNQLCSTQIDQLSSINADYPFEDYHQNNCYGLKYLIPVSKIEYYYIIISFLVGVLSVTLLLTLFCCISLCCKRRREKNNNNYKPIIN